MATDYTKGDYRVVADRLRPAAVELVGWCDPRPGEVVVDVGAGTGNVAVEAAGHGARVVAVDRVVEQLAAGRAGWSDTGDGEAARAATDPIEATRAAAGPIAWVAGDAHALPLRDGVADAALSTFALIYATDPAAAVAELRRVCRPGGRVGMTAWPADGFQGESARVLADAVGRADDEHDHIAAWGSEDRVAGLLAAIGEVEVRRARLETHLPSVDAWWQRVSTTAPPLVAARERLGEDGFAALGARLREAARRAGREDVERFVHVEEYLVALATVG